MSEEHRRLPGERLSVDPGAWRFAGFGEAQADKPGDYGRHHRGPDPCPDPGRHVRSRLGEAQLAARLNVSRGPVREALQRLIQEGLLVNRRNRGVSVVSLDEEEMADVYLARGVIEREAGRLLIRRADTGALGQLRECVDHMSEAAERDDWVGIADADLRFHESLVRSSRSKRLQRMFGTLMVETRICLSRLESAGPAHERLVEEHENLLAAILQRDERRTLQLIDAHLRDEARNLTG
jgi:DNA-binding GntR family transcriptional regulator